MTDSTLPPGWTRSTLGEIGEYHNGRGFKKSEWKDEGRPIVRIQNLTGSGKGFNYYQGEAEERHVVRKGDLLVSWAATLGVFKWSGPEAVLNQHIFKVESHIHPDFHRYLLEHTLGVLQSKTHGSGMVHITRGRFDETEVWVPPSHEQRRIVEAIETHLSHLDAGVELLERAKRNVARMRHSMLRAALSGSMANGGDRGESSVQALFDQIEEEAGQRPRSVEPEFSVPSHWTWVPLEDVTHNLDSRRIPLKATDRQERQGPYPYYGAQGIIDHIDDYLFEGEHLLIAEDGANLLSRNKPLAFIADGQFWVNNHAHILRTRGDIPLEFIEIAVNASDISKRVTGTAQPKLTQKSLRSLPIPLPPHGEQAMIVEIVQRHLSLLESVQKTNNAVARRSNRLRVAILAAAFTGELVG